MTGVNRATLESPWLLVVGSPWVATWHGDDAEAGTPADWEGWTGSMLIRSADDLSPLAHLDGSADGALVALSDSGNITAYLSSERTAQIPPGLAVFELSFTDPNGMTSPALRGHIHCTNIEGATS